MRRSVSVLLAILGWLVVAIALRSALDIPAAQERAVAMNDYAGVGLIVFRTLFLLLPVGFLIVSLGHMIRPRRGSLSLLPVLALGTAVVLLQVAYVGRSISGPLRLDGGAVWYLLVTFLVAALVFLDIRSAGRAVASGVTASR